MLNSEDNRLEKVVYKTSATAEGGGRENGRSKSNDSNLDVKLESPKAMGGTKDGNNPEQLFAVGYAACFLGAMKFYASQHKDGPQLPEGSTVTCEVSLGKRKGPGFGIDAELTVSMPGLSRDQALKLAEGAHNEICPYSHATRGNVDVKLTVA